VVFQDLCLLEETERGCLNSVGSRIIVDLSHIDELVMFSAAPTIYHYILLCALPMVLLLARHGWFDV
jgi:hypothetical protein